MSVKIDSDSFIEKSFHRGLRSSKSKLLQIQSPFFRMKRGETIVVPLKGRCERKKGRINGRSILTLK